MNPLLSLFLLPIQGIDPPPKATPVPVVTPVLQSVPTPASVQVKATVIRVAPNSPAVEGKEARPDVLYVRGRAVPKGVKVLYWPPRVELPAPPASAGTSFRVADGSMSSTFDSVFFPSGSAQLQHGRPGLSRAGAWLRANPKETVVLKGFTDPRGTAAGNLELARRRAEAVREELVKAGAAPAQVSIRAEGAAHESSGTQEERHWRGRRVELVQGGAK